MAPVIACKQTDLCSSITLIEGGRDREPKNMIITRSYRSFDKNYFNNKARNKFMLYLSEAAMLQHTLAIVAIMTLTSAF